MIFIRPYRQEDWRAIQAVHDAARKIELDYAGLPEAFLPLSVAAEREGLFDYPGLFVAEKDGQVVGFAACNAEELAWLYVDPACTRQGIGRTLIAYALERFPNLCSIEVLVGNTPAKKLYESMGFALTGTESGVMPGNESFSVTVWGMERKP